MLEARRPRHDTLSHSDYKAPNESIITTEERVMLALYGWLRKTRTRESG